MVDIEAWLVRLKLYGDVQLQSYTPGSYRGWQVTIDNYQTLPAISMQSGNYKLMPVISLTIMHPW